MTFGENIKNLRIKNNLTQKELAEKLNLSRPTIGRYESDERFPDKETIIDLAELFDVSIDEIFGRKKHRNRDVFIEEENSFKVNKIDKILCEKEIDKNYLNDEEFVEDLIEFGYKAAIKIKLCKEK
ncbi:helix-turn-helix transcriptional regulator [Peptoniphilus sp.]|uniref:helix-turn-helix domain-containing protein n=1 Tax=Peptoniphilus sp. TaxID=1971214 RepID=UPI002A82F639|nr:helix-turn-helix transcriptional regulator [Peptoniphilus sp.]MDY3901958.1 helix-turn-helix transcriptional regulator [Peptoniphilus sp.]